MSSFLLEIITPRRIAFSDNVEMVTAPSTGGTIGILAHHAPLFTRLVEGELKIIKKEEEFFLAIGDGFLEVNPEKVTILVTSAYHAHEINEQEVSLARKRAEEALLVKPKGSELIEAQTLFKRSVIALKVAHRKRRSSLGQPSSTVVE